METKTTMIETEANTEMKKESVNEAEATNPDPTVLEALELWNTEIKVKPQLNIYEYVQIVEDLVREFYDENGNYVPHYGELNALRLFYNYCVEDDIDGIPHTISEATQLESLILNKDFMAAYRNNIYQVWYAPLTFSDALSKARSIIEVKNNSFTAVANVIKQIVADIEDKLGIASNEHMEDIIAAVNKLAEAFQDGGIDADKLISAIGKSEHIQNLVREDSATIS